MTGEAPQEPESCATCGRDWEECQHDWMPDGAGGFVLVGAAEPDGFGSTPEGDT